MAPSLSPSRRRPPRQEQPRNESTSPTSVVWLRQETASVRRSSPSRRLLSSSTVAPLREQSFFKSPPQGDMPMSRHDETFFEEQAIVLESCMQESNTLHPSNREITWVAGIVWRSVLKYILVNLCLDPINCTLLSRGLQLHMPYLTSYESYLLGQVIKSLSDVGACSSKHGRDYVFSIALQNLNVSRILVQQVRARVDWVWHWDTMVHYNRWFDCAGRFLGFLQFPSTENFVATRNHALGSMFRTVFGEGAWLSRVITKREGLVTDNPRAQAQNLAAESNGFEAANRNQYGTYVGRRKTREFRVQHRLPVDESTVRTFIAQPLPTMLNNGLVHVLRQVAKHWHNMILQQNFAHQRMEQLGPYEALRFHMPQVLVTLASYRGRNIWDSEVLAPMIKRLQELPASKTTSACKALCKELQQNVVVNVCGGVALLCDPLHSWLEAIYRSCDLLEKEAHQVYELIESVEMGIRLGHNLMTQVEWKIPSDAVLKQAILNHIHGKQTDKIPDRRVRMAMNSITPRDKRTLIELVKHNLLRSKPCQLLLNRAKTLLQRELRRDILNQAIQKLSKGEVTSILITNQWYWLEEEDRSGVYIYRGQVTTDGDEHLFVHLNTDFEKTVSLEKVTIRRYVPVAEAICRAQRAFLTIELDHGKRFAYNAFMEFTQLRCALRRLIVISQVACEDLDNARLNVLTEVQRSNQAQVPLQELEPGMTYYMFDDARGEYLPFVCERQYAVTDAEWTTLSRTKIVRAPPQSMIVIGGGPTGLMTTIHCAESVLASGGVVKLYEARDAFSKGGSAFERSQIVRLDARWIAMLRYHLGTGFEDVFIPASGETDSQLGNTLPSQGFVEITIKDLENMLHVEVSKMWSKGLIQLHTDSRMTYDPMSNSLTKLGEHLKLDDGILRRVDKNGQESNEYYPWKVVDLKYKKSLGVDKLHVGEEYGIYVRTENAILPFTLSQLNQDTQEYKFESLTANQEDLKGFVANLPSVYPKGTTKHAEVDMVIVQCEKPDRHGGFLREKLSMDKIKEMRFTMDIGRTHVVEAIGKPHGSKVHFQVTTCEPNGVCCMQGLKISMGMHNFGEKRWGSGILDDIRSQNDQNTRIIGDFTKMVRVAPVTKRMVEYMTNTRDRDWQIHFEMLIAHSDFPQLNKVDPIVPKIQQALKKLSETVPTMKRRTLQTRFFETGDNYYLGMEFTREYDKWKNDLVTDIIAPIMDADGTARTQVEKLRGTLMHHIDRLWYDGVLETIRTGDVYNPGARHRVPRLYLINSYTDTKLGSFPVGESFRLSEDPSDRYEIMIKGPTHVIVRNVEGIISRMSRSTKVRREGNLTRGPDGNDESKVALATFPVSHYVNHRTLRPNDSENGYVFAFIGDEQATPHFMRYSGLTGACINAMLFNNFITQANDGVPFINRYREYSIETNWSNGEVVQRGTGANYGEDGFLRPGFAYDHGIDYLHSKIVEYQESEQDLDNVLSRDWKIKFAASFVPRGMEFNKEFIRALRERLHQTVFNKFVREAMADWRIGGDVLKDTLLERRATLTASVSTFDHESYWNNFLSGLGVDEQTMNMLEEPHLSAAKRLDQICIQVIEYAKKGYLYNERISSEFHNQPKPVDSILDDFAVEAQNFANSLTQSAAFASGALAFRLMDESVQNVFSAVLAGLNIFISFGTMTNVARYKIRNEEARVIFADEKLLGVMKGVFSLMNRESQDSIPIEQNPFVISLEHQVNDFVRNAQYYDYEEPVELLKAYQQLKSNINDPIEIREFMTLLTTKFIVDTYHVNSYVQEDLVRIVKTLDDMHRLLTQDVDRCRKDCDTRELFDRLTRLRNDLEGTLQRGATRFGFVKRRHLFQWDCTVVFKYFYSLLCCSSRSCVLPTAPISTETLSIIKHARHVSAKHDSQILRREIRDLEGLYWATRESDIASLIFMSSFLVFIASIVFTIARIFHIPALEDIAFWATTVSAFGAILAAFHLWRKFLILVKLMFTLGKKIKEAQSLLDESNIRKVRRVTFTQILLTSARFLSAAGAAVALPWSVAVNGFGDSLKMDGIIPFWIALGSVCTAIGSTIFFFLVEYRVRYNLSPKLGEFVCESFRDEIEDMYNVLSIPMNDVDTKQVQERETWEYVAREFLHRYRFDAVFAADRFGSILQYIQGGLDPREYVV